MPIRKKAVEVGLFGPSALVLLNRVFHDTAISGESDRDRKARASRIIGHYNAGVTDETELRNLTNRSPGLNQSLHSDET